MAPLPTTSPISPPFCHGAGGGAGGGSVMTVLGPVSASGGSGGNSNMAGATGPTASIVYTMPDPDQAMDKLRMFRMLVLVYRSWAFRLLPKEVRRDILNVIGDYV